MVNKDEYIQTQTVIALNASCGRTPWLSNVLLPCTLWNKMRRLHWRDGTHSCAKCTIYTTI